MKNALRTASVVAVVVVVAFGYVRLAQNKGYALKKGSEVPGFNLPALDGPAVDLGSYRGKVVLVNFWATWCGPCVSEMPSLERLHRTLGPEGLAVVAVSTDEDEDALRQFVKQYELTMPVLRDPGGRGPATSYHTTGYPETFVLDRAGLLLQHTVGPAEWDSPEALAYFRGLLEGATPAS
jgi:cytochrome c biogenesis protein CcmG/thiol:disulfide interchange protein DsbE